MTVEEVIESVQVHNQGQQSGPVRNRRMREGEVGAKDDEIFGPILPIVTVEDIDEAIRIVNSRLVLTVYVQCNDPDKKARDHPLALYVFAKDAKIKKKVFESTQSGSVLANDVLLQVTGR